jgi:hypothetical protein
MSRRFAGFCLLSAFALVSKADAAPAEIAAAIHSEQPFGVGAVRFLVLTAYRASLWTDAPAWSMTAPFALIIRYGMGFASGELGDRTIAEMKHVDPALSDAETARLRPQLARVFPAVKSGDRITALYVPGKPVVFFKNGVSTGSIRGRAFARDFFGIWLSPNTSDPDLRRDLLKAR